MHFFQRNKQIAETIIAKIADTQELRKELQNVKKLAREHAKAITLRIPQLKDCKNHFDKKKEKGKGTPERKDYIMDSLVVPVEE